MQKIKETLGGCKNIKEYIDYKLGLLENSKKDLHSLFELMFSEKNNIFYESTDGYKINKVTYGETKNNIDEKSIALIELLSDIEKNSIIGLYMANSLDWLELFWAILQAGYRPLLVNTRLDDDTLNKTFSTYDVKAVISIDKKFDVKNIYLSQIKDVKSNKQIDKNVFANEVLLMSSNTSSHLKICVYTGLQFCNQIKDSASIIKNTKAPKKHYEGCLKLLTFLPFYHIFGLIAVYIWFCFFARTLVELKDFKPKTILNTVKKHKVTHIFSVPLLWENIYKSAIETIKGKGEKIYNKYLKGMKIADKLINRPILYNLFIKIAFKEVRENIFGESICFLITGGGYISKEALSFINNIGYHLCNGYGMTELGITSFEQSDKASERIKSSVGVPFSSIEYKINEDNELLVRGKSIACKVYSDGKCINIDENDWFNTHDLFEKIDEQYYIKGRKDDLIICKNGENLNPNIYEPKLYVDGIKNNCIFEMHKKIYLISELSKYIDKTLFEKIDSELKEKVIELNLNAELDKIIYTNSSLIDENDFKVNRNKIKKKYLDNGLNIINFDKEFQEDTNIELLNEIREIFAKALNKSQNEITFDSNFFFDLSGTSLDYFTMITLCQDKFDISYPTNISQSVSTVRDMANYIKKN